MPRAAWLFLCLPILAIDLPVRAQGERHVFVVAPNGSDANAGSAQRPFATPQRARDAARRIGRAKPVVILLRAGTYFLSEPLVLTPEDSGTRKSPVTWAAWPGEAPVLSAGRPVRDWRQEEVRGMNLWVAPLEGTPRQLWVNQRRAERPRLPKSGYFRVADVPDLKRDTPREEGQTRFQFNAGEIRSWHNLQDVEVIVLHFWVDSRMPIESVNEANRTVQLAKRSIYRLTDDYTNGPARYWVENVFEALSGPGQWYHDRRLGKIYYYPRAGETPNTANAVVSNNTFAVRIEGRPEDDGFVEHLHFRGITLSHGEAHSPPANWPKPDVAGPFQAAFTAPGLFYARGYRNGSFADGIISQTGSYAMEFSAGSSSVSVARNRMRDLGAGGVKIGEIRYQPKESLRTGKIDVSDNYISAGGRVFPSGVAVWVGHSGENRLAHNEVHDFFYTAISLGWSWGYKETGTFDNIVEYNHIHHLGQGVLSDMGGIYTLGVSPGTVLRNNLIHDVTSNTYGGFGIYFDEGTSGVVAENNVVYGNKSSGFHQHMGRDNVLRNNIFALNREVQLSRHRNENHMTLRIERNIVYWTAGVLLAGNWDGDGFRWENNLFWNPANPRALPSDWHGKGVEFGSRVGDPGFLAPERGDFRLRDGSPARGLGILPIDVSRVGPRPAKGGLSAPR